MKKQGFGWLSLLVIVLLMAACGGGAEPTAAPAEVPTEAPTAAPTEAPAAEEPAATEAVTETTTTTETATVTETTAPTETTAVTETTVVTETAPVTETTPVTETSATTETAEVAEMAAIEIEPIKIALIMPSTINDVAWSQSIYTSLKEIQDAVGEDVLELAYTENMFQVPDAAAAIRDYAADGYELVIAHGAQYGDSLLEIAPDFPDVSFAWGTTTKTGVEDGITNVFAYEPRGDEAGYVTGVLAAMLSEAGIIGLVGPVDAGDAKLHVDGFLAGVKATNPDTKVNVSFTGSFGDTALAAEAANTHVAAGADVLTGSSQQVVGAIGVAQEKGVPWIGVQADQSPVAPEIVAATAIYDWKKTLVEIIQKHQAGTLGGEVLQLTYANGGIRTIYSDTLPPEAVEAAQAAEAGLIDGSITIVAEPR